MRRSLQILAFGVMLAAVAYAGSYVAGMAASRKMLQSSQPELAWLKQEFHLSDAEFARVSDLHDAYLPKCATRCRHIAELTGKLEAALSQATTVTPEINELLAARAEERAACQSEMLDHFFAVSKTMPEAQGRRYLAWVQARTCLQEPALANHDESTEAAHHHH